MCLKRFETDNIITCQLKCDQRSCDKKFIKTTGIFHVGKWFCAERCINDDKDIQLFNEMEEKNSKMLAEQAAEESEEGEIDL